MKLGVILMAIFLYLIDSQDTCYCFNGATCLPSEICPDLTKCEDNCTPNIVHQSIMSLFSVSTKRPNKKKIPTKRPTRKPTRRPSRRPSRSPTRKPTLQRLQIDLSGAFDLTSGVAGYITGNQFVSIIYQSNEQISKPNTLSFDGKLNDNVYVEGQTCPFSINGIGLTSGFILRSANNQCEIVNADSNSPLYQVPTLAPVPESPTLPPVSQFKFPPFLSPPFTYPRSIQQQQNPPTKPTQNCNAATSPYLCG